MSLAEIEYSVHEAIDAGDPDTIEMYAAHAAESLNDLGELLCLAIINSNHLDWSDIISVASRRDPSLSHALTVIEQHIDRDRAAFIESRARNIADAVEHDAQLLAELQAELNGECRV